MWCAMFDMCVFVRRSRARGRRAAFSGDVGARGGRGGRIMGRIFFFCCPENRPWFPGTMQLMRVSPRKIRLWHHGFLKHTAEPTLSPTIIKPQWISTVDWNWERGRISFNGLDTLKHLKIYIYIYMCTKGTFHTSKTKIFLSTVSLFIHRDCFAASCQVCQRCLPSLYYNGTNGSWC